MRGLESLVENCGAWLISTEILEAGLPRKQTWCVVTAYSKVLCI